MVRYFDSLITEEILSQRRFSIRAILVQGDGRRGAAANRLSPQLDSSRRRRRRWARMRLGLHRDTGEIVAVRYESGEFTSEIEGRDI